MNFQELNIISPLQKTLDSLWFTQPTAIQEKILHDSLKNLDVFWCAQTGSGKTLSFILTVLTWIYKSKSNWNTTWVKWLILAPTRELAIQIWEVVQKFAAATNIKYSVIFWWVSQLPQTKKLETWCDLIISTTWRLIDLIDQGFVDLKKLEFFVLDEADKMLDMWFFPEVEKIISLMPKNKQSLFFSATINETINNLCKKITPDFKLIEADKKNTTKIEINQSLFFLKESQKKQALQYLIKKPNLKTIIVFVNTKDETDEVLNHIKSLWILSDNIHRNRSQNARQRAIYNIKNWKIKVLVATDIASRWIDIDNLSCVINYSLPKDPEVYIHRIWRTWRAWNEWLSYSFYTEVERPRLENIQNLIWMKIPENDDKWYVTEVVVELEYLWQFGNNTPALPKKKTRYYR